MSLQPRTPKDKKYDENFKILTFPTIKTCPSPFSPFSPKDIINIPVKAVKGMPIEIFIDKNKNNDFSCIKYKKIDYKNFDNFNNHQHHNKSSQIKQDEAEGENIFIHLKYPSDAKISGEICFQSTDLDPYFVNNNNVEIEYFA